MERPKILTPEEETALGNRRRNADCLQRGVVLRPDGVTASAQRTCCNWLAFCLTLGWKKESLDALEQMWWDYHDRTGKLKQHNV